MEDLTPREHEVLECIKEGLNNTQIAKKLIISKHTAKSHVCSILRKLNAANKIQAVVIGIKTGLILI